MTIRHFIITGTMLATAACGSHSSNEGSSQAPAVNPAPVDPTPTPTADPEPTATATPAASPTPNSSATPTPSPSASPSEGRVVDIYFESITRTSHHPPPPSVEDVKDDVQAETFADPNQFAGHVLGRGMIASGQNVAIEKLYRIHLRLHGAGYEKCVITAERARLEKRGLLVRGHGRVSRLRPAKDNADFRRFLYFVDLREIKDCALMD